MKLKPPAAENAVLFLWATAPMLPDALRLMNAWGFKYRSHLVWRKDRMGTGYWFRFSHELLLVGVRGDVPAPAPGRAAELGDRRAGWRALGQAGCLPRDH